MFSRFNGSVVISEVKKLMLSVAKCMGIMSGLGIVGGGGASYLLQSKVDKTTIKSAQAHAKDGKIPVGGMTKDGKMWDGAITVDEFKKNIEKKRLVSSAVTGLISAIGVVVISGVTLLLRGKAKVKP